jgi:betaine-aldehyde dehydrogenase
VSVTEELERLSNSRMFVGGEWCDSSDGAVLPCVNPSDETEIGQIPDATTDDVDRAVDVARAALPAWSGLSPVQRARKLLELAKKVEANEAELARIDALDSGNPIRAMLDDVRGACREIELFAGLATEIKADAVSNGGAQFAYGIREPYGVVGRIIPFNHPFKFAVGKSAAALVAGNTVVLKPSEDTSLSAIRFAELTADVLPPGVFNVVTGRGARVGAAIAAHPLVPRVAFTGGVPAGRSVLRAAAEHIKHVTLELGGKNPMIVFPDVDPVRAAKAAVDGMNIARSQGQSCQSNSRVFVHEAVHEAFVEHLVRIVNGMTVGDPLDPRTDVGPLAYRAHYERVLGYVEAGVREGAKLVAGGGSSRKPGFYLDPTVFDNVQHGMTIAKEEIFGPVVSVIPWHDYDSVIDQANDSDFGLTANIWTNDLSLAHSTAHRIQAGYVWINGVGKRVFGTPFGGYKLSGLGKEGSLEEILEYTRHKVIAVGLHSDAPERLLSREQG